MIDNYTELLRFLSFPSSDSFYLINIVKRRKDNPDLSKTSKLLRHFEVKSFEDFEELMPKIQDMCIENNARAYIYLTRLSYKRTALKAISMLSDYLSSGQPEAGYNVWHKAATNAKADKKLWVVDLDTDEELAAARLILHTILDILNLRSDKKKNEFICNAIKSKSGIHIITEPFDKKVFYDKLKLHGAPTEFTIFKRAPTLLFSP